MARGNQRDKAREKNLKKQAGEVSRPAPSLTTYICTLSLSLSFSHFRANDQAGRHNGPPSEINRPGHRLSESSF